jgi:hypothetical protein
MTTRVITPKVAAKLAFGRPDAGVVTNYERCVHYYYGVSAPGFGYDPFEDLAGVGEARRPAQRPSGPIPRDGGQAGRLAKCMCSILAASMECLPAGLQDDEPLTIYLNP